MSISEIKRENFIVELEEPTLFIDNQSRKRSGHMTHALAGFSGEKFISFNANSSAVRHAGHSAFGWVEYCLSNDSGKNYSELKTLPYSYESMLDGVYCISVEKAVVCSDDRVVAFCLRNSVYGNSVGCTPWASPTFIISDDKGESWSQPKELTSFPGRIYDALYKDGNIYVLMFCNDDFLGKSQEDKYRLFVSEDNGQSFKEASVIPIDTAGRAYGAMIFDEQNRLHVYTHNSNDECNMDHAVSEDCGKTWTVLKPCFVAKGIRNPQIGFVDGVYVLHGRAGGVLGFVLYTSENATDFDEGTMLIDKPKAYCFYSNNITLSDEKGKFLLIRYSDTYDNSCRVNVWNQKLRIVR